MSDDKVIATTGLCSLVECKSVIYVRHDFGFDIPCTDRQQASRIAAAINRAHERGREDIRYKLRTLLGIED